MKEKVSAFERAALYISRGIKTEKAIWDYLGKKEYPRAEIFEAVQKLKEYNYIDDAEYARVFVNSYHRRKGKQYIKIQLFQKGVKGEIIEACLEGMESQSEVVKNLAEKYMKNKPRDKATRDKLVRHLLSKGFSFEEINQAIAEDRD